MARKNRQIQPETQERGVGRPTKLTPVMLKTITDAMGTGLSVEDTCLYAGIGKSTFYEWIAEFPEFADAIKTAEVKAKMRRILRIEQAARDGHWQADAWYLERKYPEEFGKRMTLQISAEDAALLKRFGMTLEQGWKILIQEIAQELFIDVNATDSTESE